MFFYIAVIIYILSTFLSWLHIKLAYSKNGIWHGLTPSIGDIFGTFMPLVNTFDIIISWCFWYPKRRTKDMDYSKFFNLKL